MTIKSDLEALQVNAGLFAQLLAGDETATVTIGAEEVPSFNKRAADAVATAVAPYASASAIATSAAGYAVSAASSAANAAAVVTGGTAQVGGGAGKIPLCDSNGNLHIGTIDTVPIDGANTKHLMFDKGACFSGTSAYGQLLASANVKYDTVAAGPARIASGYASNYLQINGEHRFSCAASGNAGDAIAYTTGLNISASAVRPGTDNTITAGAASYRWSTVYAGTGTINTSDAREKNAVIPLGADELAAAQHLAREIGTYQFLSAVAEKGEGARHHVGMTVQRAISVMQEHNLNPFAYGFICYDTWENEDGTAGDRYSFRPDELMLFIARGQEARIAALEAAAWPTA